MTRRWDAGKREAAFAAPFVVIALAAVAYGVFRLIISPPESWTLVLTVIASVVICAPFHLFVGRGGTFPGVGVGVVMLAIQPIEASPVASVCVWTIGVAVSQVLHRRSLLRAAGLTGLGAACGLAFALVQDALAALGGAWWLAGVLLGTAAYYALFLLAELARRRITDGPGEGLRISELSPRRLAVALGVVGTTAALMRVVDAAVIPWLERDPDASLTPLVVLLAATLFYVAAQREKYAAIERRLSAVVDAAVELPRETDGGLAAALLARAQAVVRATRVEFRDGGPERNEIGAPVSLEEGVTRHIVASHKAGGAGFTREDERALEILAHVASEAARIHYEVDTLERRANTDALTGLPNYGAFQQALVDANENRLYHEGIALLFIDLDNFKKLNDDLGHRAGDELLRALAARLQATAGGGDFVSRVGGDEFVVILSDLVSLEQAKEAADRLIATVSQPLTVEGHDLRPVVSAGLAYSSHRELDARTLVEDADRTMLQVKRSRRRGGPIESSSVSISSHRSSRTNDIVARAIRDNRLMLAFQPIVDIEQGRVWAFEALVRYIDPELGPVSPPSLVARAKSLGLMNDLTRQVVTKALEAAEQFRQLEPGIRCITVNLELGQITEGELGPFIRDAVRAHPDLALCIELNERSLRSATDDLRRDAEAMQDAGVILALDDYGSDDSSVGALVHFPMNILKIDKSLISDLDDARQREVVKALQGYGDNLGYTVIVEGIETPEMVEVMRRLGVRSAQGYYFGRPVSFALTMDRLRRHRTRAALA